jgi:hypothetical protein
LRIIGILGRIIEAKNCTFGSGLPLCSSIIYQGCTTTPQASDKGKWLASMYRDSKCQNSLDELKNRLVSPSSLPFLTSKRNLFYTPMRGIAKTFTTEKEVLAAVAARLPLPYNMASTSSWY